MPLQETSYSQRQEEQEDYLGIWTVKAICSLIIDVFWVGFVLASRIHTRVFTSRVWLRLWLRLRR